MKQFVKNLLKGLREETSCGIQKNGCPCNTCFHSWAFNELKLNDNMSHLFWIVVLALRGDYTQEELLKGNISNFKEIITKYE